MPKPKPTTHQQRADITLITGQSGSGKSRRVLVAVAAARRVIVWDVKGEYRSGFMQVRTAKALQLALASAHEGRIAYVPASLSHFDFWCKCAYAWGRCTVVAEELADVTSPGKAPEGWGWILRRGRERELVVYGITQRPSESDKTIMGNVTRIRCCAMARAADRAYMARELDLPQQILDGLSLEHQDYVEKDIFLRKFVRGSLETGRESPLRVGPSHT